MLSIKIRNNKNIKGITIDNIECKLSQFADDTSLLLDGSEQSLNETLQELDNFYILSGLKLNCNQTKIVWIGSKKYNILATNNFLYKIKILNSENVPFVTIFLKPWIIYFGNVKQSKYSIIK